MKPILQSLATVSAATLALLPIAVGLDIAGVFWWTQYVAGLAISALCVASLTSLASESKPPTRSLRLLVPIGLWLLFVLFQGSSQRESVATAFSAATLQAYQDWAGTAIPASSDGSIDAANPTAATRYPLTIDAGSTRHYSAVLALLMPLMMASLLLYQFPKHVLILLAVVASGVAVHSFFGFWFQFFPEHSLRPIANVSTDTGFGSFVNRNNAALHLNIGLAASLGLLTWLYLEKVQHISSAAAFDLLEYLSAMVTPIGILAVLTLCLNVAGLLACGSRSGLLACVIAMPFCLGRMGPSRRVIAAVVGLCVLAMSIWIILPSNDEVTTVTRLESIGETSGEGISNNVRWAHWADGLDTAIAHLPGGSGLATYGYAYLPFQTTSAGSWFQHADNLYLELLVEQGIAGIILASTLLFLLIQSLLALRASAEPIDAAIGVAFSFLLVVLAVSQIFDFGLIIPSNLFLVSILAATLVVRAGQVAAQTTSTKRPGWLGRIPSLTFSGSTLVVLLIGSLATQQLHRDSIEEYRVMDGKIRYETDKLDLAKTQSLAMELAAWGQTHRSARLFDLASTVAFQAGRLAELPTTEQTTPEELAQAYRQSSLRNRRKQSAGESDDTSNEHLFGAAPTKPDAVAAYQQSVNAAISSLRVLPLGIESRAKIAYLDFVHRDPTAMHQSLKQLSSLQENNPQQLLRIAALAADANDLEIATRALQKTLVLSSASVPAALAIAIRNKGIAIDAIIPDEAFAQRAASGHLLSQIKDDGQRDERIDAFLSRSVARFECETASSAKQQAYCYKIQSDVLFQLGQPDQGLQALRRSVDVYPADYAAWFRLIDQLRRQGLLGEAGDVAFEGRKLFPNNDRFRVLQQAIAREQAASQESNQ